MKVYVVFKDYGFEGYGAPEAVYTNDYQMHKDYPGIVDYEDEHAQPFDFLYKTFEI